MAKIQCVCPPRADGSPRHPNGDTLTLREKLDFRSALAARNTIVLLKQEDDEASAADILASLTEVYLLLGVTSWTLADEKGKPLPLTRANLRAFMEDHPLEAMSVGDEADALFSEAVIAPLVKMASSSSQLMQIDDSTSQTSGTPAAPRKRRKPSSIITIPTADTERMSASRAGDYS